MPGFDVIAVGRSGLDLYAEQIGAPFAQIKSFAAYVGGTPANIAVGASRLGLRTALATAVSDDPMGDFITRFLEAEGVATPFIARKPGTKSGLVLLGIMPPDQFPRVHLRDNVADQHLTIEDLEDLPLSTSKILVVVGTSLTHSPGREATLYAAEQAGRFGVHVVLDLDYRADLWPDARAYAVSVGSLLRMSTTVVGTREEILVAAGRTPSEASAAEVRAAVRVFLQRGPKVVIEKRGREGARVHPAGGEPIDVPGFQVAVQNTLGAGDAFAAGFVYGCLQGWAWPRAARFGNACGAIVVGRHACSASCPTRDEVIEFIRHQDGR